MKKTLLATALAVGFVGAAQAQTSVTLYGVLDGGIGYTRFKQGGPGGLTATQTGFSSGNQAGSRWGLRGSEELGDGLKAIFQLESGFDLFTGQSVIPAPGRLFGREAWLGLTSDAWGAVKFGRQMNFASQYVAGVALPQDDAFAVGNSGATFTSTGSVRVDNAITYETPVFSGFQFGIGYSFEVNGNQAFKFKGAGTPDDRGLSTALRYSNGPLTLAASYDQLLTNALTAGDIKSWALAGSYDFDVVKLHLGFGQDKNGVFTSRFDPFGGGLFANFYDNNYKTNNYGLGVTVPLTGSEFKLAWQSARVSGFYKNDPIAKFDKASQHLYTAVYTYDLSKRTNVYVFANYGTGHAFDDVKVTQAVVGLRHQF